ncbi:MAG: transglycosylase domain-containing protein [Erysipelotrichaceae bacterium]|nr:transglycosylase domain-containing protein [Erysipelotrichaceae bacterium]
MKKTQKSKRKVNKLNVAAIIVSVICLIEVLGILASSLFLLNNLKDKPELSIDDFQNQESSIVYDAHGDVIAELGMTIRENVGYNELPTSLIDAFVAVEDSRFFSHNGFDVPRFTAALLNNIRTMSFSQGGSTFTMQLVKNTYFVDDEAGINAPKKISRKIQEIALAMELENETSKKNIFELYLNKLNFGGNRNIRGVEKAAEYYYGKSVTELNLAESAMLAGVINAPYRYNPFNFLDNATERRNEVLHQMYRHGYITAEEEQLARTIKVEDLLVDERDRAKNAEGGNAYQAYIDAVVSEVYDLTNTDPYTTPMKIYTYMEPKVQSLMDDIQAERIEGLEFPDEWMEVASISVNTKDGSINAVLGGRNYAKGGELLLNHAVDQYKQPGSSIKPILDYAPAFETLGWSTSHSLVDKPIVYPGTNLVIRNFSGYWRGEVTIRDALGNSLNTTAIQALQQVIEASSVADVVNYMNDMGFDQITTDNFNIQFGIGGGELAVSTLQMAGAQAALINGGQYNKPHTISKIEFMNGRNPVYNETAPIQAISPQSAYQISDLLYSNVYGGYANLMQILRDDYPIYAKTGTTDWGTDGAAYNIPTGAVKDSWVIASTTDYTVATWLGYEKASVNQQSYIIYDQFLSNLQGKIANAICDKNVEVYGMPERVQRPDGLTTITHIIGTYPYAAPISGMDEQYIISGLINTKYAKLVDPQASTVEKIDEGKTSVAFDTYNNELKINWPAYPDESKTKVDENQLDISLRRSDGSVIIEAFGTKLFDYSWVFGPIRYKADIKVNNGEVRTVTSETTEYKETLEAKPGDTVEACLYYAYEKQPTVRSENNACSSFTLENKPVDLQLPSANLTKDQIAAFKVFENYGITVKFVDQPTTNDAEVNTYTFTFRDTTYRPGDTVKQVLMSDLYDAEIICTYMVPAAKPLSLSADKKTEEIRAGDTVRFSATLSDITWSLYTESAGISLNVDPENSAVAILTIGEEVAPGTEITITVYSADQSSSVSFSTIE